MPVAARRIYAAGGLVLKGRDCCRIGALVVADAVLTGEPDGALRPTLRQDEGCVRIGCDRDCSFATKDRRQFDPQRIPRRERDPRRSRVRVSQLDESLIGRLPCDVAVKVSSALAPSSACAAPAQGRRTGCDQCSKGQEIRFHGLDFLRHENVRQGTRALRKEWKVGHTPDCRAEKGLPSEQVRAPSPTPAGAAQRRRRLPPARSSADVDHAGERERGLAVRTILSLPRHALQQAAPFR